MIKELKFKLAKLGFWLLKYTRDSGAFVVNNEVSKESWDKIYKRGRIHVIMAFNLKEGERIVDRKMMIGDMRGIDLSYQQVQEIIEKSSK